jgi:hypothetical protein
MKNLYKSLANFQQECPVIHKGTTGYGYTYADLPAIFEVINPLLNKHGLGFYQAVNGLELVTVVFHVASGETIEHSATIPQDVTLKGMNQFQVLGSAITYMRRYQLSAMLGIVTDKDTDASGQQVTNKKEAFTPSHKGWGAAVQALAKGDVKIEQIKAKYELSKQHENKLNDEAATI